MANNRAGAEAFILKYIEALCPGGDNIKLYKTFFASMSNGEFDKYMQDIESGVKFLVIYAPNFNKNALSLERNFKIAEQLNHNFFERLWIGAKGSTPAYLTPIPYLVMDLPVRRASQLLVKKLAVAENNKSVDSMTGQLSSATKGARLSFPEMQVLAAMGLDNSIIELTKYRGGDVKGYAAMKAMLNKYGTTNMGTLANYASGVESTRTFKTFLNCMHIRNTL